MTKKLGALVACLTVLVSAAARAEHERIVWADVIDVEPIVEREVKEPTDPRCFAPMPNRAAGLSALLRWSLAPCDVITLVRSKQYSVRYAWGGREYEHLAQSHPGARIALRIEVALAPPNR